MFYVIGWVLAVANAGFAVYNLSGGDYALGVVNALSMLIVLNAMRSRYVLDKILR